MTLPFSYSVTFVLAWMNVIKIVCHNLNIHVNIAYPNPSGVPILFIKSSNSDNLTLLI
jgi:hypothetical protein